MSVSFAFARHGRALRAKSERNCKNKRNLGSRKEKEEL